MPSSNLALRITSALALATVIVAAMVFSPATFQIIIGVVAGMALYEWLSMSRTEVWFSLAGTLYIVSCVACFAILNTKDAGIVIVLGVVWTCDIGAYTAGRLLGGPLLVPWISPNKTWAGAAGGLFLPVVIFLVLDYFSGETGARSYIFAGACAILIALATQVGDLLESAAKRHFGVKDSGWIMPGHGGILDRIDGLLLASPVALLITSIFGSF